LKKGTSIADLYCYKEDGNFEDMIVQDIITDPCGNCKQAAFSCVGISGQPVGGTVEVSYLDIGPEKTWFFDTDMRFCTTFIDYHNQSCPASGEKTFKVRHFVAEGNE